MTVHPAQALARNVPQGMGVEDRVRRFWRSLSSNMDAPMYGADARGSLFNEDFASGWNVDDLNTLLQRNIWPPGTAQGGGTRRRDGEGRQKGRGRDGWQKIGRPGRRNVWPTSGGQGIANF